MGKTLKIIVLAHLTLLLLGVILAVTNYALFNGLKLLGISFVGLVIFQAIAFLRKDEKSSFKRILMIAGIATYLFTYSIFAYPDFLTYGWTYIVLGLLFVLYQSLVFLFNPTNKFTLILQVAFVPIGLPLLIKSSSELFLTISAGVLCISLFSLIVLFLKPQK
jgi:hypothetical protein